MTKDLVSIQYLRGVAALMVVMVHMQLQLVRMGYSGGWPQALNGGVDIFFVISGFIMWTTTVNRRLTPWQFLGMRLSRIVPLYWFITSLLVAALIVAPNVVQSGSFDLYHVIASYLFIPAVHPVLHSMEPVLIPGWTLNYEMFFYVIFAACLLFSPPRRIQVLIGVLAACALLHQVFPDENSIAGFLTSEIVLEFAFGAGLGVLFSGPTRLPIAACLGLFGAGIVAMFAFQFITVPRFVGAGIPAALMVAGALYYERERALGHWPVLKLLGDASYSLYLTHGLTLSVAGQVWRKLRLSDIAFNFPLFVLFALLLSSGLAILVYRIVEQPVIAVFRQRRSAAVLAS